VEGAASRGYVDCGSSSTTIEVVKPLPESISRCFSFAVCEALPIQRREFVE